MATASKRHRPAEPGRSAVGRLRARKRPKGAPTHVRSWPLRPDPGQCRAIRTRFFTGARVYNAVLGEFIVRSHAVKSDPAWQAALQLPRRTKEERASRRAAFDAVVAAHGFTTGVAQSFASSLRQSWTGWVEPLADRICLNTVRLRREQRHLDRQHRAGSSDCFNLDGTHKPGRCRWERSHAAKRTLTGVAEQHRRLAEHRKTLHGALANRLLVHGADIACEKLDYVAWQKNFPRSVRDRAPGLLVEMIRRKAASAGGDRLYEFNPKTTALSQNCLCGKREKKPLSQRAHRCGCGINEDRDLFAAYFGLHVRRQADGSDRLDLQAADHGWLHRHDVDGSPRSGRIASLNRRGRRHLPSRRSVARIKARRAAKRQSRSARTSTTNRPTAIAA